MKDFRFRVHHRAGTPPPPPSSSDTSGAILTLTRDTSVLMGIQPVTRATAGLFHLVTCEPSGAGFCRCLVKPQERTILHGILTGQGHKFGYGGGANDASCVATLISDTDGLCSDTDSLCMDIAVTMGNHQMDPSREVILPLKYTTPPRGK